MSKRKPTPVAPTLSAQRILLQLEGFATMAASCAVYGHYHYSMGWFAATFLVPDLAMAGYLANRRFGAATYNLVHTYLAPLLFSAILFATGHRELMWMPLVWTAHIGFDRALGYGLKYGDAFRSTHLGRV